MKKKIVITSKKQYHETMAAIYELMNRGEANLTKSELERVRRMAEATELFEDETLELRPNYKPDNLPDMVKLVMLEKKISQGEMAEILEVGKPKLSQLLNGKRKPDLDFLKHAYKKLKIDPTFILEHI
ncbi:MAG TPA: helix-turn-helix transcriptional regulator [Puia sp.]